MIVLNVIHYQGEYAEGIQIQIPRDGVLVSLWSEDKLLQLGFRERAKALGR
jgi:hypothetical protein